MQCRRRRVRRLATDLQASYDRIDSLVNNAGAIFATRLAASPDGAEGDQHGQLGLPSFPSTFGSSGKAIREVEAVEGEVESGAVRRYPT